MNNKISETRRIPRLNGGNKTRRKQHGGGKHGDALKNALRKQRTAQIAVDSETSTKIRNDAERILNKRKTELDKAQKEYNNAVGTKSEQLKLRALSSAQKLYDNAVKTHNMRQGEHTKRLTTLTNATALVEQLREPAQEEAKQERDEKDKKTKEEADAINQQLAEAISKAEIERKERDDAREKAAKENEEKEMKDKEQDDKTDDDKSDDDKPDDDKPEDDIPEVNKSDDDKTEDDKSDDEPSDDDNTNIKALQAVDANTYYQNIPFFTHPIFNDENFKKSAEFVSIANTGFFTNNRWKNMIDELYTNHVDDEDQQRVLHNTWKNEVKRDLSTIKSKNVKEYLDMINALNFDALIASDNDYTLDFKWWIITKSDISKKVITSVCENMNNIVDDELYMWLRTYVIYEGFMCGTVDECRSNYLTRTSVMGNNDMSNVSMQSKKYTQLKSFLDNIVRHSFILWAKNTVDLEEKDKSVTTMKDKTIETLKVVRRTRLRATVRMRRASIKIVVTTMKPTYYYWIIYDINNILSKATRQYIYDIMKKSSVLDTPTKVCDTMFNIHNFARMNDSRTVTPFENIYNVYKNVSCVPFESEMANPQPDGSSAVIWNPKLWERSSAWDMYVKFEPIKFSTLYEEVDDNTQMISRTKMTELFNTLRTDAFQRVSYTFYFLGGSSDVNDDEYKYKNASQQIISVFDNFGEKTDFDYPYTLFGDGNKDTWNIALFRMFGDLLGKDQTDKRIRKVQRTTQSDGRVVIELAAPAPPATATPVNDEDKDDETIPMTTVDVIPTETLGPINSSTPSNETTKMDTNNTILPEFIYIFDEILETYIKSHGGKPIDISELLQSKESITKYSDTISEIANEMNDMTGADVPYEGETIQLPDEIANDLFSSVFIYFHLHSTMPANYHYTMLFGSIPCSDLSIINNVEGGLCWPPVISSDGPGYGNLYKFVSISGLETLEDPDEKINFFKQPTGTPPSMGYMDRITQMDADDKNNIYTATKQEMMEKYISPVNNPNAIQSNDIERMDTWKLIWFDNDPTYKTLASIPEDEREKAFTFSDVKDFESRSETVQKLITSYVGPHGVTFDDALRKQMYVFYNKQMHGLLSSDSMKERMPEIMRKWEGFESVILANREAGYIYWTRPQIIQYNMFKGMVRGHYPVAIYLEFAGMHSMPSPIKDNDGNTSPVMIHRKHALLWLESPLSVKKTIEIANPRLYHGMMKHIWSGDPPSSETNVSDDIVIDDKKDVDNNDDTTDDKTDDKTDGDDSDDDTPDGRPVPVRIGGTVFTTVPGYQNMRISPSMFGLPKDSSKREKVIRINPTVKLYQSAVNMAPEEDRKRQFFDYGLFYTLNSRSANQELMGIKNISFKKSVKSHIIDHNIKITLDTLFAPGTVIYLGSEPYTIYSANFDETKWRLGPSDTIEPEVNVENVINAQMLQIQNKEAISEMQSMPDNLKLGDGISSETLPEEFRFVEGNVKETTEDKDEISKTEALTVGNDDKNKQDDMNKQDEISSSTELVLSSPQQVEPQQLQPINPQVKQITPISDLPSESKIWTDIPDEAKVAKAVGTKKETDFYFTYVKPMINFFIHGPIYNYTITDNENQVDIKSDWIPQDLKKIITKNTKKNQYRYYNVLNHLNKSAKEINPNTQLFKLGGSSEQKIAPKTFNQSNYKNHIEGLIQIVPIAPDGHCFFTCIATALNLHNFHSDANNTKKYVFKGTDYLTNQEVIRDETKFDQKFIRWAVVNEFRKPSNDGNMEFELLKSQSVIEGHTSKEIDEKYKELHDKAIKIQNKRLQYNMEHWYNIHHTQDASNDIGLINQFLEYPDVKDNIENIDKLKSIALLFIQERQSTESMFLQLNNNNFSIDKPFSYPNTVDDAYNIILNTPHYADQYIITMVENIFGIKTNIISKDTPSTVIFNDNNKQVVEETTAFRLLTEPQLFRIDSYDANNKDDAKLTDKIDMLVFLHFEGNNHYNLIVFDSKKRGIKDNTENKPKIILNKTRKLVTDKPRRSQRIEQLTRRVKRNNENDQDEQTGGGNFNPKLTLFYRNTDKPANYDDKSGNAEFSYDLVKQIIGSSFRVDRDISIPMFMLMFIYVKYNNDRVHANQSISKIYDIYRPYYKDLLMIDGLINHIPDSINNNNQQRDFLLAYTDMFGYIYGYNGYNRENKSITDRLDILKTSSFYLSNIHSFIHNISSIQGGAPPTGRDTMNNISTTTPHSVPPMTSNTVPIANTVYPHTVSVDPSNVLSEHVLRIMNDDSSTLSFKMDVHLIVAPGDHSISMADKLGYACESSKQDMSRSWSEITGKPYYPTARKE